MKISFILANYNRAAFVHRSIKSYLEFEGAKELIVVDGLSTDGSFEFLENYADVIVSEKDASVYEAWNKGLRRATGDWVCFLNTDDQLLPDFNKIYRQLAECAGYDIIRFKVEIQNLNQPNRISLGYPRFSYFEIISSPVYFNGYIFASHVFTQIGNFNESFKYCSDQDFLWRCKEQKFTSKFLNTVGYRYTMHSDSLTISRGSFFFEEERQIAQLRFSSAKNSKSKKMADKWVEWESLSSRYPNSVRLRTIIRLLSFETFSIQLYQLLLKIKSPVARIFD